MRIRLEGTAEEVDEATQALREVFVVQDVSGFYPNRGASVFGRVYVTGTVRVPGAVRAKAARTDRTPPAELES